MSRMFWWLVGRHRYIWDSGYKYSRKLGKVVPYIDDQDDKNSVGHPPSGITKTQYYAELKYPEKSQSVLAHSHGYDFDKAKRTFDFVVRTREFEIELYWKRATYFWAFIAATFTAYLVLATTDDKENFEFETFLIICVGYILSLAWHLTNLGSKFWQRHWEKHLDLLEDGIVGPLYKTVYSTQSYSVSKINSIVSFCFVIFWVFLGFKDFFGSNFFFSLNPCDFNWLVFISFKSLPLFLVALVTLSMWKGHGRGRFRNQKITMYRRNYRYEDKS